MKKPIGLRINEIFNSEKVSANPSILNLNFTHHESCFPDEELKKNNYNVTTLIDKFTVPDFTNSLKKIEEKKIWFNFLSIAFGFKSKI